MNNLKLLKGTVDYVILFLSNSAKKWMLPTDTLRSLGAQNGNMIHIFPADIQSKPQSNTKKSYEFENKSGNDATFVGKDGEIYIYLKNRKTLTMKAVEQRTPQPSAKSQIDILLSSERSPERQAEIHKMGAERGLPNEQLQWAQCPMNGFGTEKKYEGGRKMDENGCSFWKR